MRNFLFLFLLMLLLTCCKSKQLNNNIVSIQQELKNSNLYEMQKKGVDFYACGSNPEWRLEIDFDAKVLFFTESYDQRKVFIPIDIEKEFNDSIDQYKIKSNEVCLLVTVKKRLNPFNTEKPYTVTVKNESDSKKEVYEGNGSYFSPIDIHEKWVLEELNGIKVAKHGIESVPFIEIHLENNKVNGFLGCNRFGTKIYFGNKKISFHHLMSTKMACLHTNLEKEFSSAISNKEFEYFLENEMLILIGKDDKIIFKKQ